MSIMAAGMLTTANDEQRSSRLVRESFDAFYAAEAGLDAIVAEWGTQLYDTLMLGTGDSVIIASRTLEGGCSYGARIHLVDSVSGVFHVIAEGRGSSGLGGSRTLTMLLKRPGGTFPPTAVATAGALEISGSAKFTGPCGGVHADGDVNVGGLMEAEEISSSGTVDGTGATEIVNANGDPVTPQSGAPDMTIPDLNPMDFCDGADFIMRSDGTITNVALSQTMSGMGWGYKYDPGNDIWMTETASEITGGTLCVEGNFALKEDLGTAATPLSMSVIAGGSVEVSANPYMTPSKAGIGIIAGGDLKLNGSPTAGATNFSGLFYAGSQCVLSGKPKLSGQLACANKPNPSGAYAWASQNIVSGEATIEFDCNAFSMTTFPGRIRRLNERAFGSPVY